MNTVPRYDPGSAAHRKRAALRPGTQFVMHGQKREARL
jgi:hypothetical protein